MPNEIDDKVAGAKTALAKANAKFPSPKPTATAAPKTSSVANMTKTLPNIPHEDLGEELAAKSRNVNEYLNAPKMHKGGVVSAPEGRSSEYRKVYVARRQSRQGGGNVPVKGEQHDPKKAKEGIKEKKA